MERGLRGQGRGSEGIVRQGWSVGRGASNKRTFDPLLVVLYLGV